MYYCVAVDCTTPCRVHYCVQIRCILCVPLHAVCTTACCIRVHVLRFWSDDSWFSSKLFLLRFDLYIIIKKGWQYKAGRERLTPYQSEDPNSATPTHRMKEEKGKTAGDRKRASSKTNKKALALLLKPASPTPSNTGSLRSFHRDTDKGIKARFWFNVMFYNFDLMFQREGCSRYAARDYGDLLVYTQLQAWSPMTAWWLLQWCLGENTQTPPTLGHSANCQGGAKALLVLSVALAHVIARSVHPALNYWTVYSQ